MILPTNKMPNWYYDKKDLKNTPSIRDGLDFETDRRYRMEGARFIMECGTKMGLGHNTMATGVVYFHRFYVFHSFKSFPRYVTACCCVLLAGKVEETPKKCRDIIQMARSMLSDQKFLSFGKDPKEEVMTLERILLQTIKFDLQVEHPYSFLVKYAKCLKGDQVKLQKMVQMAWNFVNDSLSTTVCLQWEPEIIAVALIHLASKLSKFTVTKWDGQQPTHLRWWDMFVADVTMEILEDICHQVLDLYQQNSNSMANNSPPQLPASKSSPPVTKRAKTSPPLPNNQLPAGGSGGGVGSASGIINNVSGNNVPIYAGANIPVGIAGGGGNLTGGILMVNPGGTNSNSIGHHNKKATIDEKLENMPIRSITSMPTDQNMHYTYPPAYGTMFPHAQFGHHPQQQQQQQQPPPPPQHHHHHQGLQLPQQPLPPPPNQMLVQQQLPPGQPNQPSMYHPPPSHQQYPPNSQHPQIIQPPPHYQSGMPQAAQYYQPPPPPTNNRGGYYQGP